MSKKKIYITSSILLGAVVVPSIATFIYLNINVKPGVDLVTNLNNNYAIAYNENIKLDAKLVRISSEHEIEYKWYAQVNGNKNPTHLAEFDNQKSIEFKNPAIENVNYFVEINDKDDEKTYRSQPLEIIFKQPNLYISGEVNGIKFNPFKDTINNNVSSLKLKANLKKDISDNAHAIEGWFIFKNENENEVFEINELLETPNNKFDFINSNNFIVNVPGRELTIDNVQSIKSELAKGYTLRYFWTNTIVEYTQDVQFKFEG